MNLWLSAELAAEVAVVLSIVALVGENRTDAGHDCEGGQEQALDDERVVARIAEHEVDAARHADRVVARAAVDPIAAGATVLSHVNDSGFWLVSRFFGMDEKTTLKTWTVMETTLGVAAFAIAGILWLLV